jgi:hypothetical protein
MVWQARRIGAGFGEIAVRRRPMDGWQAASGGKIALYCGAVSVAVLQ